MSPRHTLAALPLLAIVMLPGRAAARQLAFEAPPGEELVAAAVSAGTPRSCVQSLPPSAFRRTMVFLVADHPGAPFARVPEAAFLSVRLATESIAWQARGLLGAPEGLLPPPDTIVNWQNLGRHLHLVGHRDGRITWSFPWDTPGHRPKRDSIGEVTLALLGRATDAATAKGERFAWPDSVDGDSIPFLIRFDYPELNEKGKLEPMRGQYAAPLLEVRVPAMTPVEPRRMGQVRYPEELRRAGVQGTLVMQFVVDTTGAPVERTVRDLWPDKRPRMTPDQFQWYNAFLREVKRGLSESEYRPARIGGCAVPQLVQQPFDFRIHR